LPWSGAACSDSTYFGTFSHLELVHPVAPRNTFPGTEPSSLWISKLAMISPELKKQESDSSQNYPSRDKHIIVPLLSQTPHNRKSLIFSSKHPNSPINVAGYIV